MTVTVKLGDPTDGGDSVTILATPSWIARPRKLSCSGHHDVSVYNILNDSRLQNSLPGAYKGDREFIVNTLARQIFIMRLVKGGNGQ